MYQPSDSKLSTVDGSRFQHKILYNAYTCTLYLLNIFSIWHFKCNVNLQVYKMNMTFWSWMPNILSFHVATLSYFNLLVKMNWKYDNHGTSIPRLSLSLFVRHNKHQNRFNSFSLMYLTGTGCHPQSIILSRLVNKYNVHVYAL
jgi:hypothetical protein